MAKTDKPTDSAANWAKHLRPLGKRQFNKKVRQRSKNALKTNNKPQP